MKRSIVSKEIKEQEVKMHEFLNESKLRINLQIFTGFKSKMDINTFQSEFLKIYV